MTTNITRQPGYYRDILESLNQRHRGYSGATVDCVMYTTVQRRDSHTADEDEFDVRIEYQATLTAPRQAASYHEPGHGNDWEFDITDISIDLGQNPTPATIASAGGPLTDAEKERVRQWFDHNSEKAAEIADNSYDPDMDHPDL